jgi:hypothetical protein
MPALLSDSDLPAGLDAHECLTLLLQGLRDTELLEGDAPEAELKRLKARQALRHALARRGAPSPQPLEA